MELVFSTLLWSLTDGMWCHVVCMSRFFLVLGECRRMYLVLGAPLRAGKVFLVVGCFVAGFSIFILKFTSHIRNPSWIGIVNCAKLQYPERHTDRYWSNGAVFLTYCPLADFVRQLSHEIYDNVLTSLRPRLLTCLAYSGYRQFSQTQQGWPLYSPCSFSAVFRRNGQRRCVLQDYYWIIFTRVSPFGYAHKLNTRITCADQMRMCTNGSESFLKSDIWAMEHI